MGEADWTVCARQCPVRGLEPVGGRIHAECEPAARTLPYGNRRLEKSVVFCAAKEVPLGDDRERAYRSLIHSTPDDGVYRTVPGSMETLRIQSASERSFAQEQNSTRKKLSRGSTGTFLDFT